jgi:thioredoxin reductase
MNYQYDLIIIGDSKEGNQLVKNIASANINIKIAFISREFKSATTPDFLNVEYIKDEVVLTDYKNRLFGCYLKSGNRLYATHLVFAVGQKYAALTINNKKVPNVFNTVVDVSKEAKQLPAVVLVRKEADVTLAFEVAKKYKYVYICLDEFSGKLSEEVNRKLLLKQSSNIVVLPNTHIKKVSNYDETLLKAELDNYSTVLCAAIFVKTEASPDTSCVPVRAGLIKANEAGYLEVDNKLESTLVPKCFAIGNCCAQKCTKKMVNSLIDTILTDFGGN